MAATAKKTTPAKSAGYNSNPFTLAFNALGNFFSHNAGWAIALVILGLLGFAGNLVQAVIPGPGNNDSVPTLQSELPTAQASATDATVIAAIIVVVVVIALLFILIVTVVDVFLKGMFSYVALRSNEGKSVSFNEAFQATLKKFWTLLGASLLADLKILGWFLLFIIPGIVAALRYSMLPLVIMNETPEGVGASHNRIKSLVKGRLWEVFGVNFVAGIIPIVGTILKYSGEAALYKQLQVYNDGKLEKPKVHWLNYIGLIAVVALILLVSTTALLVFVFARAIN